VNEVAFIHRYVDGVPSSKRSLVTMSSSPGYMTASTSCPCAPSYGDEHRGLCLFAGARWIRTGSTVPEQPDQGGGCSQNHHPVMLSLVSETGLEFESICNPKQQDRRGTLERGRPLIIEVCAYTRVWCRPWLQRTAHVVDALLDYFYQW